MFANLQLGDKLTTYIYFISSPPPPPPPPPRGGGAQGGGAPGGGGGGGGGGGLSICLYDDIHHTNEEGCIEQFEDGFETERDENRALGGFV